MPLAIGVRDIKTAFGSVAHADAASTLREAGATPYQVLAIPQEMQGEEVEMNVPGIATTDPLPMSSALKTGGHIDPLIFSRMFD